MRVDAPQVSNFSTEMLFNKQWATLQNKPTLLNPADGVKLDFFTAPDFRWQPVTGASRYRYQIATSTDFSSGTLRYDKVTLATSYQPEFKLSNGTYYWRVLPIDPGDREGTPSEVRTFEMSYGRSPDYAVEVPTLLEPLDNSHPTFTPTFRWTAVPGAQYYKLEYTSDPTCNFGAAGYTISLDTHNTSYTPTDAFPNDVNYCWHVRAHSGASISDWSDTWEFQKQWYIQAVPLTPVNNYQYVKNPIFSWSPVPGAAYYKIEVCSVNSFPCPNALFTKYAVNPYYVFPSFNWGISNIWYWRITPYDRRGNSGKPSDGNPYPNPVSFHHDYSSTAPHQIYPLYYYLPNDFPPPNEDVEMQPHEDRTVPLPIFIWNRVFDFGGNAVAPAYRVQVTGDPLFISINWEFDTENLSAVPTVSDPFTPQAGQIYYWRVCILNAMGGTCSSPWSQIWHTRIDTSKVLTSTSQITLLRPQAGSEHVEITPLFEWWPLQGADSYQVQISQDPNYASTVITDTVPYPAYMPQTSLAQRSLNHLGYGTYYWRVRGLSSGSPLGNWSAPWRFQLASQSQWRDARILGNTSNRLLVASDPVDLGSNTYELANLYTAQDKDYWYFGFDKYAGVDMAYTLYIDLDHTDNSGATADARGFNVTTIAAHRPEYAIYLFKRTGTLDATQVFIYRWTGTGWANNPQRLSDIGGALYAESSFVEIRVPNTAIGMAEDTNSTALSLFTINESNNIVQDTVPSSTNNSILDRFTSVSERINLVSPPSNVTGDPTAFPSVPPFFFNFPLNTPWEGYNIQISVDPLFTTLAEDFTLTADAPYYAPPHFTEWERVDDIQGDNTYYWRIRPQYYTSSNIAGSWSQAGRFEREGFIPQNLQESVTFATPTFSWDMMEGAKYYDLQVDNDPNFGSPEVNINTDQNSYTPQINLSNGTYFWHVRAQRDANPGHAPNDWSPSESFILSLPIPTGLTPNNTLVHYAPTMCWYPVLATDAGTPVLAAWKYRLQVSTNPNFPTNQIFDTADTEQTCWTPLKGYDDGLYYWRVAIILDGNNIVGDYSPASQFTKQYPVTTLLEPPSGGSTFTTPTFVWSPVNGANKYKLEVSLFPTYSPTLDSVETNNTRYTPTVAYAGTGVLYYWRVAIIDRDNKFGPYTNATVLIGGENLYIPFLRR